MKRLLQSVVVMAWLVGVPASLAQSDTLVVGPGTAWPTITAALASASPGSTIRVQAGVYQEQTLVVDRAVRLVGDPGAVLDGEGERAILLIQADSVHVKGFTFRNVGVSYVEDRAALKVDEASHCVIEGNRFENTFFAIYLAKTTDCRVAHNEMVAYSSRETAAGNGIHLWYCRRITIEGNQVRGHRDGIYLEFVEDSEVVGNVSRENLRYGLHFMFSDRCAYRRNQFIENDAGVAVMYTEHIEIVENTFERNWGPAAYGILLKDISDGTISRNVFRGNSIGLYAEGVNRLAFTGNSFASNGWAIKLMANSLDNTFSQNTFAGNSFDVATNSRQNYSRFSQNYWDRYEGYDLDRDGLGDVPFRPVRLFALLTEQHESALILMRSLFVDLLDTAERLLPVLTPETLIDAAPLMQKPVEVAR